MSRGNEKILGSEKNNL